jgi:hypothetical protein
LKILPETDCLFEKNTLGFLLNIQTKISLQHFRRAACSRLPSIPELYFVPQNPVHSSFIHTLTQKTFSFPERLLPSFSL